MTDDLRGKLALLTDDRPEPAEPAGPIRLRIKRRQLRRRTTAAAVCAAAATAAVVVGSSVLGSMKSAEPGVATPATSPTPQSHHADFRYTPLPVPWSDEPAFTTQPDSLKYAPAFYVASGSIPNERWAVASYINPGCLIVTDEGPAKSFGGAQGCFNESWQPDQRSQYKTVPAVVPNLSSPMHLTMVMGAVSADARKVRITADGQTFTTDAVGTPNSSRLRFFALVVDAADITAVTPLNAAGEVAAAPR
ncbi:hypothetical protein OHA18_32925 [Kribbella sp. NBC_00709]|uniref:hypothetical protein n=1 Tax=Kribbella sp. NBC_00709 TaxID=2975972 RepID=UPI002E29785E|nr:hypothetical protein [Kribbella sp. NBC_00709]